MPLQAGRHALPQCGLLRFIQLDIAFQVFGQHPVKPVIARLEGATTDNNYNQTDKKGFSHWPERVLVQYTNMTRK
jgi:hypothetical protein